MELKDKLKNIRTDHNLSQNEFAKKIFVSRSTVAKWENGLGLPKKLYIDKICEEFNIEREYLSENLENDDLQMKKNLKIHRLRVLITLLLLLLLCFIAGVIAYISYININEESKTKRMQPPILSVNNVECSFSFDNVLSNYKNSIGRANVRYMSESAFAKGIEKIIPINKCDKYVFDPKEFDGITVYYYWYDNDFCFYEINDENPKQEINDTFNDNYVRIAKINDNYFVIPDNDYHNLIEIRIKLKNYYFIYYFLAI